jgi:nicotinate phosphoribosyltransferase
MDSRKFEIATESEIKSAQTTDVYFQRTKEILVAEGLADLNVVAEITASSLPKNWEWGILAGVEEAAHLLENVPVTVTSFPEGSVFHSNDSRGIREPVMVLEGRYADFCVYETPLLGLLCHASGIATMAARVRVAAGNKTLLSFGIRRAHPVLAPMIDRACYIGGFDAVSSLIGAKILQKTPIGTMPHSLIVAMGDQVLAWKSFDKHMPKDVPRIMLVDTYCDEKTESIMAAEALKGKLYGVRLDTPSSRRGSFPEILREVRWELDARGFNQVKIYVSGGLDEEKVRVMAEAGADGFGVGTSVSNAPSIDFAMDIVEAGGKPVAKRGKLSGKKQVWRCDNCLIEQVVPVATSNPVRLCPKCGKKMRELLEMLVKDGKLSQHMPSANMIREYTLKQLASLATHA